MASDFPNAELERLQRLLDAVNHPDGSPLPWMEPVVDGKLCCETIRDVNGNIVFDNSGRESGDPLIEDARLLVAAVNALPALLVAIAELRAENARLRELAKPFAAAWPFPSTEAEYMDYLRTRIIVRRGDIRRIAEAVKEGTNASQL